jgi:hypothetical protein
VQSTGQPIAYGLGTPLGSGNPVSTLVARYFGVATADIAAVATAEPRRQRRHVREA